MNLFRNFRSVTKTCYGRGSFDKLGEILEPERKAGNGFMVFVVDDHFLDKQAFTARIPAKAEDEVHFISSLNEPSTKQVDALRDDI